jgi:polyhydroxyalkanoate synthase
VCDTPAVDGSWWTCWRDWLHARSSGDVPARTPAAGLAAAPGTYVLET